MSTSWVLVGAMVVFTVVVVVGILLTAIGPLLDQVTSAIGTVLP